MNKEIKKGFTLVELALYMSISLIIGGVLITSFFFISSARVRGAVAIEVLDNSRSALDTMLFEVAHAEGVYTPTSFFGAHPGQLSLETTRVTPSDESATYLDFYLDGERLYLKRENQTAQILVADKIKITNLVFTHLNSASLYHAVRISLTANYDTPNAVLAEKTAVTLTGTASLRAY